MGYANIVSHMLALSGAAMECTVSSNYREVREEADISFNATGKLYVSERQKQFGSMETNRGDCM